MGKLDLRVGPPWLTPLLSWMDDNGTGAAWPAMVKRRARLEPRLSVLTGERSVQLEYRVRALCVREAMRHTSDAGVLAACEAVAVLCEGRGRGEVVDSGLWATTKKNATAAEETAETGAGTEAASAAVATAAAGWAATAGVEMRDVSLAAEAAIAAAGAVAAAENLNSALGDILEKVERSWGPAADRLTCAILDELERELLA